MATPTISLNTEFRQPQVGTRRNPRASWTTVVKIAGAAEAGSHNVHSLSFGSNFKFSLTASTT